MKKFFFDDSLVIIVQTLLVDWYRTKNWSEYGQFLVSAHAEDNFIVSLVMITVSLRFIADNSDNIRKHDQLLVALGYWMYGDNTSRFILFSFKNKKILHKAT